MEEQIRAPNHVQDREEDDLSDAYSKRAIPICISSTTCYIVNDGIALCSSKFINVSLSKSESLLRTEHWCRSLSRPIATTRIVTCFKCTLVYSFIHNDEFVRMLL